MWKNDMPCDISCLSIKFSENLLYFECFHMNEHVTMLAGIVLITSNELYTNLFDFTEFNEFHLLSKRNHLVKFKRLLTLQRAKSQ